jgi:CRP-like cAMP-binding protein
MLNTRRDFSELLGLVSHSKVVAPPRFPMRQPDAPDNELVVVLSGLLALYTLDQRGQRHIIGLRFPGEAVLPGGRFGTGLWPLTKCELAVAADPQPPDRFGWPVAVQRGRDLSIAYEWLTVAPTAKDERLAHLLCELAVRGGYGTEAMPNQLTQNQLADITGQTSVNVNRKLAELEDAGLIARENRQIIFRDWPGLVQLAGFNAAYLEEV